MDETKDYYTKWSKAERQNTMYHLHVETKIDTNELIYLKMTLSHREQICGCLGWY